MQNTDNEKIREVKREYYREWRAKNPDKVKAIQARFWAKKAAEMRSVSINAGEQEEKHNG